MLLIVRNARNVFIEWLSFDVQERLGKEGECKVGIKLEIWFPCKDCAEESLEDILLVGRQSKNLAYFSRIIGQLGRELEEGVLGIIPEGLLNKAVEFVHC